MKVGIPSLALEKSTTVALTLAVVVTVASERCTFQKVCESFQKEKGGQIKARVAFDKMENLRDNGKLLRTMQNFGK